MVYSFLVLALTLVALFFLYAKIIPSKYDGKLNNKGLQFLHDFFNFKELYLEKTLKILFTFISTSLVVSGVVALLYTIIVLLSELFGGYIYSFEEFILPFLQGISVSVICFIATFLFRLLYEGAIIFIMILKNIIDINKKIK